MQNKGFTLMELMIVVIIVAILASIAVPMYSNSVKKSKKVDAIANISRLLEAEKILYSETGDVDVTTDFTTLVAKKYIDNKPSSDNYSYSAAEYSNYLIEIKATGTNAPDVYGQLSSDGKITITDTQQGQTAAQ